MTKTYYFTGPCKWAKVYQPDDYKGDKKWKVNLYLNKETKKLLKDSGVQLKIRDDEDGEFVVFSRPVERQYQDELKFFEPPKIFNKELEKIEDLIGNGSVITAKISVFDTAKGTGHRLEAIRVDNLVKYEENQTEESEVF